MSGTLEINLYEPRAEGAFVQKSNHTLSVHTPLIPIKYDPDKACSSKQPHLWGSANHYTFNRLTTIRIITVTRYQGNLSNGRAPRGNPR